jgi:hypothetical protein
VSRSVSGTCPEHDPDAGSLKPKRSGRPRQSGSRQRAISRPGRPKSSTASRSKYWEAPARSLARPVLGSSQTPYPYGEGVGADRVARFDLRQALRLDRSDEAIRIGESRANPNRPTWQQRKTRVTAFFGAKSAVSGSDTRGLDGHDTAESRSFLEQFRGSRPKSPRRKTKWRSKCDSNSQCCSANLERIRTAQLANREKRSLRRPLCPEPAVSGSVPRRPDAQHPAESRSFLGPFPGARGKSLQPQTEWRSK